MVYLFMADMLCVFVSVSWLYGMWILDHIES